MHKPWTLAFSSLLCVSFCHLPAQAAPPASKSARGGVTLSSLDKSVDPGKDFYLYANGGWLKNNPIPQQTSEWGRLSELVQENGGELYKIVVLCAVHRGAMGSIDQKIGDFYSSGVDVDRADRQGIQPLKHDLELIRQISDLKSLEEQVISLHKRGIQPFFNLYAGQDAKDSQSVIAQIAQAGLGLPEQDYYLRTDDRSVKQRTAYQEHLQQAFKRLGYPEGEAASRAAGVFKLETRLAQASLSNVQMRDPLVIYHPTTASDLAGSVATWSWPRYFEAMGLTKTDMRVNVHSPKYLETVYAILETTDLVTLRSYLEWQLLNSSSECLSEELAKFDFEFTKVLSGAPTQPARNVRVFSRVYRMLGQAIGQKYAETHFTPKTRAQVKEMVDLIVEVLDDDFKTLSWMSPETQQQAHAKLAALKFKIGRPDLSEEYKGLVINRDSYIENVWRTMSYENDRDLAKIGKPVDKAKWHMTPAEVNAYYNPPMNEVVIPSGIIQSPLFNSEGDDALNYGGLGCVIGHEITHGFDDEGRKYDGAGNVRDWWAPADLSNFQKLAGLVEEQFNGYTVLDGHLHLNGKLVMGESIADLGGIRLSYLAYQRLLKKRPGKVLEGFTPEQRFFLGYAHLWATNTRSDAERLQVNTGTHPPGRYRVNGPLSNMPEFSKAFACPPGSPMVRTPPIVLW